MEVDDEVDELFFNVETIRRHGKRFTEQSNIESAGRVTVKLPAHGSPS